MYSYIIQINAKTLEVGYPNAPLTVSFIGDYGQTAKKSFTSASNSNNTFSAYENKNNNETKNTMAPPAAQVIVLNYLG